MPDSREAVESALLSRTDSALGLFGLGYLAYLDENHDEAEAKLRSAVEKEPRLALAWNALGAVLQKSRRYAEALEVIDRALELAPDLAMARNNRARTEIYAHVFDRLLALLEEIPDRWPSVATPCVPYSGRKPSSVIRSGTEAELSEARFLVTRLAWTPIEQRSDLLRDWIGAGDLSELDLWYPTLLAQEERMWSREESAVTLEAQALLAEACGRADVLLWAASNASEDLTFRYPVRVVETAFAPWIRVPIPESASASEAKAFSAHASLLVRLGENQRALRSFGRAKELFEHVGDPIGAGNAVRGEADVLYRLGQTESAIGKYRSSGQLFEAAKQSNNQGLALLGEADALSLLGRGEEAIRAYRAARKLFGIVGNSNSRGNTFQGEADSLRLMGRNDAALEAYGEARRLFEEAGDRLGLGNSWNGEASVLSMMGRFEEALKAHQKAEKLYEEVGDTLGIGNALNGQAEILFHLGHEKAAIEAYRESRQLFETVGDPRGMGNSWNGEASILFELSHNEEALSARREAKQIFAAIEDPFGLGNTLIGEAQILFRTGQNEAALRNFREAGRLFADAGVKRGRADAILGEATVLLHQLRRDEALWGFRVARQLFEEAGSPEGQVNSWNGEATTLLEMGRDEEALRAYRKVKALAVKVPIGKGNALLGEANVLFRLDRDEEALQQYRNARLLFESNGQKIGQGSTWDGEAKVLLRSGHYEEALESARKAESFAITVDAPENIHIAMLHQIRALLELGRTEQAVERARVALELYDSRIRPGFLSDLQRIWGDSVTNSAYDLLIESLLDLDRPTEALEQTEQARSRVLLDLVATQFARSALGSSSQADFDLEQQLDELHETLAEVRRRLESSAGSADRDEMLLQRSRLDSELEALEFERLLSSSTRLRSVEPLGIEGMQALVEDVGPAMVYYVTADQTLAAWLEPSKEPEIRRLKPSWSDLAKEAREFAEILANPNYADRLHPPAKALAEQLLTPFGEQLPESGPLLVVPHGPIHQIPFDALIDEDDRSLGERYEITVVQSLSTLAALRERHRAPRERDRFLAMASGEGLSVPLSEIRRIRSFFDARQVADYDPTRTYFSTYRDRAPRARHLLIASQGVHEPHSRRGTYIEIEPSERHDHRLTAAEIAAIPLEAELVTLAACDTARGEPLPSDERLDLTRAFLAAGAAAVLATRWKVPEDHRTSRFLVDFYRAYRQGGEAGQGLRKDRALAEAKRLSMERGDPAQVWAAWVLVGDPR